MKYWNTYIFKVNYELFYMTSEGQDMNSENI